MDLRIHRETLSSVFHIAVEALSIAEKESGYSFDSSKLAGMKEYLGNIRNGETNLIFIKD